MPAGTDVVVIGAGQSGLAAVRALQARGIHPRRGELRDPGRLRAGPDGLAWEYYTVLEHVETP